MENVMGFKLRERILATIAWGQSCSSVGWPRKGVVMIGSRE